MSEGQVSVEEDLLMRLHAPQAREWRRANDFRIINSRKWPQNGYPYTVEQVDVMLAAFAAHICMEMGKEIADKDEMIRFIREQVLDLIEACENKQKQFVEYKKQSLLGGHSAVREFYGESTKPEGDAEWKARNRR